MENGSNMHTTSLDIGDLVVYGENELFNRKNGVGIVDWIGNNQIQLTCFNSSNVYLLSKERIYDTDMFVNYEIRYMKNE